MTDELDRGVGDDEGGGGGLAFVRSDESIEREVREDLLVKTLAIGPDEVAIRVEDGVVTLEGEV